MAICCCSYNTTTCFTCPNNMSGTWDRYPAPYRHLFTYDNTPSELLVEDVEDELSDEDDEPPVWPI